MTIAHLAYLSGGLFAVAVLLVLWNRSLRRRLAEATAVATAAGARASIEGRRAMEFFSIIAGLEQERDIWLKLYNESTHHSGVAQAWLLRDLSGAVQRANAFARELRTHGVAVKDVKIDPALTDVLAEFGHRHGEGANTGVQTAPGMEAAQKVDAELPGTDSTT